MADADAKLHIDAPVDEETESLIPEPLNPIGLVERSNLRIRIALCNCLRLTAEKNRAKEKRRKRQSISQMTPHRHDPPSPRNP
jgi:hypothetical protein